MVAGRDYIAFIFKLIGRRYIIGHNNGHIIKKLNLSNINTTVRQFYHLVSASIYASARLSNRSPRIANSASRSR